jgi:hypothetical protein
MTPSEGTLPVTPDERSAMVVLAIIRRFRRSIQLSTG